MSSIYVGAPVLVRDARNVLHKATAVSVVEGTHDHHPVTGRLRKIHDFPVIWVDFGSGTGRTPWPAEDVVLEADVDARARLTKRLQGEVS